MLAAMDDRSSCYRLSTNGLTTRCLQYFGWDETLDWRDRSRTLSVSDRTHRGQSHRLFRTDCLQPVFSFPALEPAGADHRNRPGHHFSDPHLQDRDDVLCESAGAPFPLHPEKVRGSAQPKELLVVHDDLFRSLGACLRNYSTTDVQI